MSRIQEHWRTSMLSACVGLWLGYQVRLSLNLQSRNNRLRHLSFRFRDWNRLYLIVE